MAYYVYYLLKNISNEFISYCLIVDVTFLRFSFFSKLSWCTFKKQMDSYVYMSRGIVPQTHIVVVSLRLWVSVVWIQSAFDDWPSWQRTRGPSLGLSHTPFMNVLFTRSDVHPDTTVFGEKFECRFTLCNTLRKFPVKFLSKQCEVLFYGAMATLYVYHINALLAHHFMLRLMAASCFGWLPAHLFPNSTYAHNTWYSDDKIV